MVLDASLHNTQHYKVEIKGKVEESREKSCAFPYTLEKDAFGSPLTMVAKCAYYTHIYVQNKDRKKSPEILL